MTITKMPLSELRQPEKNVRKHTDKQIGEYVRSLQMFGQVKPIIIDDDGEIICGNGLYLALVQMGAAECDCYVMEGITPNQKKKLMLADNRVYELGITDIDTFEEIIRMLGDDIDVPGWDDELLATLNASMPEVDDMVSGYGSFSTEYTDRIKETPSQSFHPASSPVAHAYPHVSNQLQHGVNPINEEPPIPTAASVPHVETANPGQIERFVVCPKCGERICL